MLAGVVSVVFGTVMAIPSILKDKYLAGGIFAAMLVVGLVLLAISFGEEDEEQRLQFKKEFIRS